MFPKSFAEVFEASLSIPFTNNIIPIQDILNEELNLTFVSPNITNKEREFIIDTNKSYFNKLSQIYYMNVLLKSKLAKVLEEKKRLNQIIIKHEQEINKNTKLIGEIDRDENIVKTSNENRFDFYRKRKRKRRKKSEVVCLFKCPFLNCNKSYPSKGSLNMHIKLKHK